MRVQYEIVKEETGVSMGVVGSREELQKLLNSEELPCRNEFNNWRLAADHERSLDEVDTVVAEMVFGIRFDLVYGPVSRGGFSSG